MRTFWWSFALCIATSGLLAGCSGDEEEDSSPSPSPSADLDSDGYSASDCDDTKADVYPDAPELCDGQDNDCDTAIDEGFDADNDTYSACTENSDELDCDDNNADIFPGRSELCDAADNDCNGEIDEDFDTDADGFPACGGLPGDDCADADDEVYPGAEELCNHADDNCDGVADDGFPDLDADGWASCAGEPDADPLDCNDDDAAAYPGADEICSTNVDENCDGNIGNTDDVDGDGYNTCSLPVDCNDDDGDVKPGAIESCNQVDDNCDGRVDESFDVDQDGFSSCTAKKDCNDKDPSSYPGATEVCDNSIDENCDGLIGTMGDSDGDGFSSCGTAPYDCNDAVADTYPGATEACDAVDNDCDGVFDDNVNAGDIYEPNDTVDAPDKSLATINEITKSVYGSITSETDEDWFQFYSIDDSELSEIWEIEVTLEDIPAGADYDIFLYKKGEGLPLTSGIKSGNADEYMFYGGSGLADDTSPYLVQVKWKAGAYGCPKYKLTIYAG